MIAKPVYLESIDRSILGMLVSGIFLQCGFHFLCQIRTFFCQVLTLVYRRKDFSSLAQGRNGKEVGRNQELERGCIIRRAERRSNQSHRFHGVSPTVIGHGIQCTLGYALKVVRTPSVPALLVAESLQYILNGFQPFRIKDACISCGFPVMIGQSQGIT